MMVRRELKHGGTSELQLAAHVRAAAPPWPERQPEPGGRFDFELAGRAGLRGRRYFFPIGGAVRTEKFRYEGAGLMQSPPSANQVSDMLFLFFHRPLVTPECSLVPSS